MPAGRDPRVVAIFGPTGVGKTAVALELAERMRRAGEGPVAISADALQVYAGLEILTGAPSPAEQERLEHRLVGIVPVTRSFSAGEYMPLAHGEIDAALRAGRRPIVLGGTGLYLRAALSHLDLAAPPPPGLRERIGAQIAARGPRELHATRAARAPEAAAGIDPADRTRVGRALELLEMGALTGPGSGERSQLWSQATRHPTVLVGLTMARAALYEAIDRRVEAMIAAGAVEEVRRAAAAGASPTARKALGFSELLAGDPDAMKRRTRNLAKRQLTWMRKLPNVTEIDVTASTPAAVAAEIDGLLRGAAEG